MHVKTGTKPTGSTWTRNPIVRAAHERLAQIACNRDTAAFRLQPACYGDDGGGFMSDCDGPQFPPPIPGIWGFGPARCVGTMPSDFRKVLNPLNFHKCKCKHITESRIRFCSRSQ